MHINDILELNGLSLEQLHEYSYKTGLGLSLVRTLHRFDKEALLNDLFNYTDYLETKDIASQVAIDYRIKSLESIATKYERYYPNTQTYKVFNDVLGFRAFCSDYADIIAAESDTLRIVDMSTGKRNDDGYRGVHVYFQVDNFHYPIEIQFNTLFDRQLNDWLHDYVYKRNYPLSYGQQLREKYEHEVIKSESEFKEIFYGLCGCEE